MNENEQIRLAVAFDVMTIGWEGGVEVVGEDTDGCEFQLFFGNDITYNQAYRQMARMMPRNQVARDLVAMLWWQWREVETRFDVAHKSPYKSPNGIDTLGAAMHAARRAFQAAYNALTKGEW
jgi:hypothetical protein